MRKVIALLFCAIAAAGCSMPQGGSAVPPAPATPVIQVQASPTAQPPTGNQPAQCKNPYYPVVDKATFFYHVSTGENVIYTLSADKASGVFTIMVKSSDATASIEGQCTSEGIVLMEIPGSKTTTSDEYGSSTVSTFTNSGVSLPNDVAPGSEWSQTLNVTTSLGTSVIESNYTAIGFENVVVPAGSFRALKVEQSGYVTVFGQKVSMHGFIWYAEGVGVVRSAMDGAPVLELTMYDFPQ